jgi:hypothetical protein
MNYPGDIKTIVLSITNAGGTAPNVTVAPVISIVRASDNTLMVNSQPMTAMALTQVIYTYRWDTTGATNDDYVAVVSYAADGLTISGRYLATISLGDSRITGIVALDATVAKDLTVAKDSTVAHFTDLATISPDVSQTVQAIKAKTDNLPPDPASLTVLNTVAQNVQDLHDYETGTWTIDKTQSPQVLTILRPSGGVLARFQLTDSTTATNRTPTL